MCRKPLISFTDLAHSIRSTNASTENPFRHPDDQDHVEGGNASTGLLTLTVNTVRGRLQGWRFGVACCAVVVFVVLILNLALTVSGVTQFRDTIEDGVGTAYEGSCDVVNGWSIGLHLVINALSAVMLSASNYTMQCLNAPTRKEIDDAHSARNWLDVGIPSMRNIFRVGRLRALLWCVLALSSVPIHLLYNSAIFKTVDANKVFLAVVNEDFFDGAPFDGHIRNHPDSATDNLDLAGVEWLRDLQQEAATDENWMNPALYERLDNRDCIAAYGTSYVSGRENVFLVTNDEGQHANQTALFGNPIFVPDIHTDKLSYRKWPKRIRLHLLR